MPAALKTTTALLSLVLVVSLVPASAQPARASRPNILLIYADDLGWRDVAYQGSDFHETPNIDRLASQGMRFTHAYAGAGNCAPSRAVLLSGQYTPRHGVYAVQSTERGPANLMRLVPIPNRSGLPASTPTLADALRAGGYTTGLFGKWHLGGPEGAKPSEQGFDVVFDPRSPNPNVRRDEPDDPKGAYSLTRAAMAFIEANRDRPFFAFVSHHAIHTALEARPASLARFRAKKPGAQHNHPLYAACLYDLDDAVGLLLGRLKTLGLEDRTLVVFTSDNGGTQQSSQEPLRGSKGGYYEGGIREPFIVRWPGVVTAGAHSAVPIHQVDLYPTFLDAAGSAAPSGHVLDGESLVPLLSGRSSLRRQAIFWHFPGYLDTPVVRGRDPVFRTRPVSVIRQGDWKLHLYHEEWTLDGGRERIESNRAVELYNIADDAGERNDLANSRPAKRDELLNALLSWLNATRAPLSAHRNPGYAPGRR